MELKYFERLYAEQEFYEALGKMTLAAGRFESNVRAYLELRAVKISEQAALGSL